MSSNQGFPAKAGMTAPAQAKENRKERRLPIAVRVKVFSDIAASESQTCCTYEVSTFGARLMAPAGVKTVGQIVTLQRHNRRAKFKVVWIGTPDTPQAGQVGVAALEPNNVIWDNEIKTRLLQAEFVETE